MEKQEKHVTSSNGKYGKTCDQPKNPLKEGKSTALPVQQLAKAIRDFLKKKKLILKTFEPCQSSAARRPEQRAGVPARAKEGSA